MNQQVTAENAADDMDVALHHGGTLLHAGRLIFSPDGRGGSFCHADGYAGPALDPLNLDYRRVGKPGCGMTEQAPLPECFIDRLPGYFALKIIRECDPGMPPPGRDQETALLRHLGPRATGGLVLSRGARSEETPIPGEAALAAFYARLCRFAAGNVLQRTGSGRSMVGETPALSREERAALATHGGARPKVAARINAPGGEGSDATWQVIAKFNLANDGFEYLSRVEKSTLDLATRCGIASVASRVLSLGEHGECCAVRRYDRDELGNGTHAISLHALSTSLRAPGASGDYREYMRAIEMVSADPKADMAEMLRRLIFNLRINNNDDHGRQFEMLLGPDGQWRLGPAYDLIPNPVPLPHGSLLRGKNFFSHSVKLDSAGLDDLLAALGIRTMLPLNTAIGIRSLVDEGLRAWADCLESNRVSERDRRLFGESLAHSPR